VEAEDENTSKRLKEKKVSSEFEYNKTNQAKESVKGRLERLRKNKISKTSHLRDQLFDAAKKKNKFGIHSAVHLRLKLNYKEM